MSDHASKVRVLVRVRPFLQREVEAGSNCIVSMPPSEPGVTLLEVAKPGSGDPTRRFSFDDAVWSFDENDPFYVSNAGFYRSLGPLLVDHLFQGFNVCLLAYGQTGSGKTYTMMGLPGEPGVIPLIIRDVLRHRLDLIKEKIKCELSFSYVEIYNEKVKDLLYDSKPCRIREHPTLGPYVEDVTEVVVDTYEDFERHLQRGNNNRNVAATMMNEASSRSHALLNFTLKQVRFSGSESSVGDPVEEMVSSMKLVDLAGSERLSRTKTFGTERMKEGTQINKSLTVLGRCIHILSQPSKAVVPYRDSTLTYLLKENLAGNSKTAMVFCISPCDFEETQTTLNYANDVKRIRTMARANACKIESAPIDWKKLHDDKSAIDTLKDQVNSLTTQLELQRLILSLVKFLEREKETLDFEITYLRDKVAGMEKQLEEQERQVAYFVNELAQQKRHELDVERLTLLHSLQDFKRQCAVSGAS